MHLIRAARASQPNLRSTGNEGMRGVLARDFRSQIRARVPWRKMLLHVLTTIRSKPSWISRRNNYQKGKESGTQEVAPPVDACSSPSLLLLDLCRKPMTHETT
jgi:hypothetical protein